MLELLLIIILVPLAIVSIILMALFLSYVWKFLIGFVFWGIAGILLLLGGMQEGSPLFWWMLGSFVVGALFWGWGYSDHADVEPSKPKQT